MTSGAEGGLRLEKEKRQAAEAAAELVEAGMTLGLGSGSTVDCLLVALARRALPVRCVAASPETERQALSLGLQVEPFDRLVGLDRLDLAIDGADQIAPDGWLVKGRGAALTREKIIAAASDRFVIIADSSKVVAKIGGPVPLELHAFGLAAALRRLEPTVPRGVPLSPDGGVIADFQGTFADPGALAARLDAEPGVVAHGLFPPALVAEALIARGSGIERRLIRPAGQRRKN